MTDNLCDTYEELLTTVVAALERLDLAQRLDRLFAVISPSLDEAAEQDEKFGDGWLMSEAVAGLRQISAGESRDVDAIHCDLAAVALVEDQDLELHVRGQAATLALAWLQLKSGRQLPIVDDDCAPETLTDIVDMLAWTRSRQYYIQHDDLGDYVTDSYCDIPAALGELRGVLTEITAA